MHDLFASRRGTALYLLAWLLLVDLNENGQILAVRLAVIARSQGVNQANVSPATLQAFASLGDSLKREVSLSSTQRSQRYRVMEIVIPVRNNLQIDS